MDGVVLWATLTVAFAAGMALHALIYRNTLLMCAKLGTPEKLPDGKFYYLVREDIHHAGRHQAGP